MLRLTFTTAPLTAAALEYARALRDAPHTISRRAAPGLTARLRTDAPWRDQTGDARRGLRAVPVRLRQDAAALLLIHTVRYGAALELRHAGRYAVITPMLARLRWRDLI
jgi:hypothetical protein